MRIAVPSLVVLALGLAPALACGTSPNNDACINAGFTCVGNLGACAETFPYECGQGGYCCRVKPPAPSSTSSSSDGGH